MGTLFLFKKRIFYFCVDFLLTKKRKGEIIKIQQCFIKKVEVLKMKIVNKILLILLACLLVLTFSGCKEKTPVPENSESGEFSNEISSEALEEEQPAENIINPYLSITYIRDNPVNMTGLEMVFYTYDLVTKELTEECVVPYSADYATGVVSKANNVAIFSSREVPDDYTTDECLVACDLTTGELALLERENWSYNEMTVIDERTLLAMTVTNQHPIVPALFDFKTLKFTYMPDANGDPFELYTNGPTPITYDYNTEKFVSIYQNERERYDPEYLGGEKEINTYISIAGKDLVRDPNKTFAISMLAHSNIKNAVIISENEVILGRIDNNYDAPPEEITTYSFYSLVFGENGETSLTEIEPPFPMENFYGNGYKTPDNGKTWFIKYGVEGDPKGGVYLYDTETKALTPILLNDIDTGGHAVNFSIVGPQKMIE